MTGSTTEQDARAAESGASATQRFQEKARAGAVTASTERVDMLATEVLTAIHDVIRRHEVTYAEYDALKTWLIGVGQDGEWPLFLDVWVEHVVEEVANQDRAGSKGTIEGPYYVAGSPELPRGGRPAHARRRAGHAAAVPGQVSTVAERRFPGR